MFKKKGIKITDRQYDLIKMFSEEGIIKRVCTIRTTHKQLSDRLNVSRQALSIHLKRLKKEGLIRTGRGFIDLTDKALEFLEQKGGEAYITIKVNPKKRKEIYEKIKATEFIRLCRVAGDSDIIVLVDRGKLDKALTTINKIEGVHETSTHVVLECSWE